MEKDFNQYMDDINITHQYRQRQIGFNRGYSVGEEVGWRDGYLYGVRKGAQVAGEIGFYQGFANAWLKMLETDDSSRQRKVTALNTLLDMTQNFPKQNIHQEDTVQRLARIRAKFKQVNALLNIGFDSASFNAAHQSWTSLDSGTSSGHNFAYSAAAAAAAGASHAHAHHARQESPNPAATVNENLSF